MIKEQLSFVIKGSEVKRFHTVRTIQEETNGHHSFLVAMLYYLMAPNPSVFPILACLVHDLAEQVIGDIPANTKRLAVSMGEIEKALLEGVYFQFSLSDSEKKTLELADSLAGIIFCKRESQLGNTGLKDIEHRYWSYVDGMEKFSVAQLELVNAVREM